MKIIEKKVEELIPYEFNNKIHDEVQVNRIANSIKEFWWTQPIVIDDNNVIIIGHWRLLAAQKLWLDKVPVTLMSGLTEAQIKKLRILDNKLNESEYDLANLRLELESLPDMNFWDLELTAGDLFPELDIDEFNPDDYEGDGDNWYTQKTDTPIYEPTGEKVEIEEMIKTDKYDELVAKIKEAKIPEDIRDFLLKASTRHIQFNYKKIAEYYSNADKEIQELFEDNALVIIDFDKAIEDWYTLLLNQFRWEINEDED